MSNKESLLVSTYLKASEMLRIVAPEKFTFSRRGFWPSPSNRELIAHLLMFRHVREGKFGSIVTLVQARFKKLKFRNILNVVTLSLDTSLPQRSKPCNFVRVCGFYIMSALTDKWQVICFRKGKMKDEMSEAPTVGENHNPNKVLSNMIRKAQIRFISKQDWCRETLHKVFLKRLILLQKKIIYN